MGRGTSWATLDSRYALCEAGSPPRVGDPMDSGSWPMRSQNNTLGNVRGAAIDDTEQGGADSICSDPLTESMELVVVFSPDPAVVGHRYRMDPGQTHFFGRDATLGHGILDGRMSKQHFMVAVKRSGIEFADVGSTNGTFVDGVVAQSSALSHGSVIRAGDTTFVVVVGGFGRGSEAYAARCAATPFPILLLGETGTGKEVLAREIHAKSRRSGPFLPVNCATFSKELIASELFGHAKGAFSGAMAARPGLFRAAQGGTLFLDEMGELPLDLQATLLRVLEDGRIRPVGAEQELAVDVRVICATHVDLLVAIQARRFRADLYARLARLVITLPPLRERREDIMALARQFSSGANISANAAEALSLWNWPRNIRELRGLIEVAITLGREPGQIHLADLVAQIPEFGEPLRRRTSHKNSSMPAQSPSGPPLVDRRAQLLALLEAHDGNISQVAQQLGKPRAQIYRWAKALGLDTSQFRK